MKRIRASLVVLAGLVLALTITTPAQAGSYTVSKSDYRGLFSIGRKLGVDWRLIAKMNGIKPPYRIRIGQVLTIPEGASRPAREETKTPAKVIATKAETPASLAGARQWKKVGGDPLLPLRIRKAWHRAEELRLTSVQANRLAQFGLSESQIEQVREDLAGGKCNATARPEGYMWSGMAMGRRNWDATENASGGDVLVWACPASDGVQVDVAMRCGNVAWNPVQSVPELETEEQTGQMPACTEWPELTVGAWAWWNGLAHGKGIYGEFLCGTKVTDRISVGVGGYAITSPGQSGKSAYKWKEHRIGPQAGVKYDASEKGCQGIHCIEQWIGKIRLAWEKQWGNNPQSGYSREQGNLLGGLYGEYVEGLDDETLAGVTAEAWWAIRSKLISSTWSGDSVQDRTQLELLGFVQRQLNESWAFRLRFGVAYTGWDNQTWLKVIAEFRYNDWLMFGPWVAAPIGLANAYKGMSAGDLTTLGVFVRIELGKFIREHAEASRRAQVVAIDDAGEPITTKTKAQQAKVEVETVESPFGWAGDAQKSIGSERSTGGATLSPTGPSGYNAEGWSGYNFMMSPG